MHYIILLNGNKPKYDPNLYKGKKVICADGAYSYAVKHKIDIELLIGDFDSLKQIPENVPVKKFSADKDKTDGELALIEAMQRGAKRVTFIGACGGREDHSYANIMLLYKALKSGVKAEIISDNSKIIMFDGDITLKVQKGYYLSLVPFLNNLHIMNTEGLKYCIADKMLCFGNTLGISNVTISDTVKIKVKSGCGIAFLTNERAAVK